MNLQDRINSGLQKAKPNEPLNESKNCSLNNTIPRSMPPSKEQKLIILQSEALTEITSQRDRLLEQGRPEDQETIQTLSSENSMLRKKLQEKSETIVSLNEKLANLSTSDLVLKENERLEKEILEIRQSEKNIRNKASAAVSAVKEEYRKKQTELQKKIDDASSREQEALNQISEESIRINHMAEVMVSSTRNNLKCRYEEKSEKQKVAFIIRMKKLEDRYNEKTARLYFLTLGGCLYSFFATILTAVNSQRFLSDLVAVFTFFGGLFAGLWTYASDLAAMAWSLNEKIPYSVLNVIVPVILAVLGFAAVFGIPLALIVFGIYKIIRFYKENFADSTSVLVALVTLALLVWFADSLTFIPLNLILVFLIVHAIYMVIRLLITNFND